MSTTATVMNNVAATAAARHVATPDPSPFPEDIGRKKEK
jgi:hypothetical protein